MDTEVKKNKLNLGCGKDIKKGFINLDSKKIKGVDIVADLERKLPFEDNYFDLVYASHVLEHISDLDFLLREIHRILKSDGRMVIFVPHFSFFGSYTDPTHKRFFGYYTMDYFTSESKWSYYSDFHFKILKKRILFYIVKNDKYHISNRLFTIIFNSMPLFYERSLCWIIPSHEVCYELKPIKN
jgi:ubiquinone/menaquinone biosynthesis C-methylase UbiE